MSAGKTSAPWWRRRSLKLRLSLSFTLIAGIVLLALLPAILHLIRSQMAAQLDRQLHIDWALIEAHLEADGQGGIRWRASSPATPESPGYAESWFDVWSDSRCLLQHWPSHGTQALHPPRPESAPGFHSVHLANSRPARTFQKSADIDGQTITLRVFRDESGNRATLRRILAGLALGMPVAVLLAALGGYLMAGRTLRPIAAMAAEARQITSESLTKRLPNPNPHDELGQLATVINETLNRLERSFDALKRFTADASHELRTPLTALRSVGEVALREERPAGHLRETVGSMLEEVQRLQDLTDTLLLLARAESGRLPLHAEPFVLHDLAKEVCERLEILAAEKHQRLEIEAPTHPVHVHADRTLLRQAITNLLHNAIRHSPPHSTIRVATTHRESQAILEITDHGPGIAPDHREKIFERFYRIDKARSRAEGGAGLGLAIARLSVELNHGTIELDSTPGTGSCFRIVLPVF